MWVAHWKGQQNCTQCKWWYRIQTPNGVISHPSGVGPGTVFKEGLMKPITSLCMPKIYMNWNISFS